MLSVDQLLNVIGYYKFIWLNAKNFRYGLEKGKCPPNPTK